MKHVSSFTVRFTGKEASTKAMRERIAATEHADVHLRTVIDKIFSTTQNRNPVYVPHSLFAHLRKIHTDSKRYETFRKSVRGHNIDIMDEQDCRASIEEVNNSEAMVVMCQQDHDRYVILRR